MVHVRLIIIHYSAISVIKMFSYIKTVILGFIMGVYQIRFKIIGIFRYKKHV